MHKKLIYESPVTQSREAVKQLIAYFNHGHAPEELPDFYRLNGEMVLVRSKKGDVYYVTNPKSCSCPAATFGHGRQCKHSKKYFPQQVPPTAPETGNLRDSLPGWKGPDGKRANGPVEAGQ